VNWGGTTLVSSATASTAPIENVEIFFWYFDFTSALGDPSTFSGSAVDLVTIDGTVVPEPSTTALFLMGTVGIAAARRRRQSS